MSCSPSARPFSACCGALPGLEGPHPTGLTAVDLCSEPREREKQALAQRAADADLISRARHSETRGRQRQTELASENFIAASSTTTG